MPAIKKWSNVTLKKGIYKGDQKEFSLLYNKGLMIPHAQTITISLLDEKQKPAMTWQLLNASPAKLSVTDSVNDDEVAIETLEFIYEKLEIMNN